LADQDAVFDEEGPEEAERPPADRIEREDERLLIVVHPAMFRAKPIAFTIHVVVTLASIVGAIWVGLFTSYEWAAIPILLVLVVALGSLAYWKVRTLTMALRITSVRTIEDRGFFSRRTSEVLHENIRNVQITQSFWNRLWGVGKLEIASAGHEGFEITFKDVRNPYDVRSLIDEHREFGVDD